MSSKTPNYLAELCTSGYPLDLHASGAVDRLLSFHHRLFGTSRMVEGEGGNEGGAGGDGTGSGGAAGAGEGDGPKYDYPAGTAVADMTPAQQSEYWREKAQKHEGRAKGYQKTLDGKTAEQIQADLQELQDYRESKMTASEKQIADAKKAGRDEARQEMKPQLVQVALAAALAQLPEADRDELLGVINPNAFLDKDGELDTAKVATFAKKHAPAATGAGSTTGGRRDFGGGQRQNGQTSAKDIAKAEADRRWPKKAATTTA